MSEAPATVLDAVQQLEADGYGASFSITRDGVHCSVCGVDHLADTAEVLQVFRFEGPSDPDEEAVVYTLRCPLCGALGSLVSAFGPNADPDVAERLVLLDARFRENPRG